MATMPSDADAQKGFFDRFADLADRFTSMPWFFASCVLIVVLWLPSFFVFGSVDTWQLIINTLTTIVTFLLVGLSQNTARRSNAASQQKLNALVLAVAELPNIGERARAELRKAIGLEDEEAAQDA